MRLGTRSEAGERCIALMDTQMRNLQCKRIQADEIWSFVGKKDRNLRVDDPEELGNAWVFVAMDAETKLIPSYTVGKRNRGNHVCISLRSAGAHRRRAPLSAYD